MRPGYSELNPQTVFDHHFDGKNLFVYTSTKVITDRGDLLDQGTITFKFSSPLKEIIRVEVVHFAGQREIGPYFDLNLDHQGQVSCEQAGQYLIFRRELKAKIDIEFCH